MSANSPEVNGPVSSWTDIVTSPDEREDFLRSEKSPNLPNIDTSALPEDLRKAPCWIQWRWLIGKGSKWTKTPCNDLGRPIDSVDRSLWHSIEFLEQRRQSRLAKIKETGSGSDALGFAFAFDGGQLAGNKKTTKSVYWGLDVDNCVANGKLRPGASRLVQALGSYAEISPTGTGIKIIFEGVCPLRFNKVPVIATATDGSEIHGTIDVKRRGFFTVTGNRVPGCADSVSRPSDEKLTLLFGADAIGDEPPRLSKPQRGSDRDPELQKLEIDRLLPAVKEALTVIKRESPQHTFHRQSWIEILMAVKSCGFDEDTTLQLCVEFSRDSPKYMGEDFTRAQLDSLKREEDEGNRITVGTLFWVAQQHGYEVPTDYVKYALTAREDFGGDDQTIDEWRDYLPIIVLDKQDIRPHEENRQILENAGRYGNTESLGPNVRINEQVSLEDRFFRQGNNLVQVRRGDDGTATIELLSDDVAADQLSRAMRFEREKVVKGELIRTPSSIDERRTKRVQGYVSRYPATIPALDDVVTKPYIGVDREIQYQPGYSARNRTILDSSKDWSFVRSTQHNCEAAQAAASRILAAFKSCRFSKPEMRAGVALSVILAFILTPLVRKWWSTSPVFLWTAKRPEVGKSTIIKSAAEIIGLRNITSQTLKDGSEATKSIESALLRGSRIIWIDNAAEGKTFGNETLEALATSENFSFRIMGGQKTATVKPTVITATGNLTGLSRDMLRRTIVVHLDKAVPTPGVVDYLSWIRERADSLLVDALTVLAAWLAEARRLAALRVRDDGTPYVCPNAIIAAMRVDSNYSADQVEAYRDAIVPSFEHWSTVVAFACMYADPDKPEWLDSQYPNGVDTEWGLNPSAAVAARQGINPGDDTRDDEENRALVTILHRAVKHQVGDAQTITARELLTFAVESYRRLLKSNDDKPLKESLLICQSVGDFNLQEFAPDSALEMTKKLGRRLASLSEVGYVATLDPTFPRSIRVTKSSNGKKAVRWGVADRSWG